MNSKNKPKGGAKPSSPSEASKSLIRLAKSLFADEETQEAFVRAVSQSQAACPSVIWTQEKPCPTPFETREAASWQPSFVEALAEESVSPGSLPLHNAGLYYCLDFSSVFSASVILGAVPPPKIILDLCASPGGKSIFAWRAFSPHLLVSNEVIGKRTGPLIANLKRCGVRNAVVTRLDSQDFAESYPSAFDLVIVDAPCSGQSLPAKGIEATGAYHPVTINMNANRQKRIIANSSRVVAPGGFLAYMTCTYSREENEGILEWLLKRQPKLQPVGVPHLSPYQSHLAAFPCYRLWPFQGMGAGGFTALLRNIEEGSSREWDEAALPVLWKSAP
jgi:16S rRNA C967 or C1407 C5-methylase (RsmB/RsmF family)